MVVLCVIVGLLPALVSAQQETTVVPSATIRYDGLYYSEAVGSGTSYLRFYADKTAIAVTSTGTPYQVSKWLSRLRKNLSSGQYTIDGQSISFSAISNEGQVHYLGLIDGTSIEFKVHSMINGYVGARKYGFVEVPLIDDAVSSDSRSTSPIEFNGDTLLVSDPVKFAQARGIASAIGVPQCNDHIMIYGELGRVRKSSIVEIWTVSGCGKRRELEVEISQGHDFAIREMK
ncbi:MAG: hypothetical protein Q7T59_05440 [Candidatus Woesebacteria bacterium]|nr:hypothetical protein [Candidatus Woesebacteria bacterium]